MALVIDALIKSLNENIIEGSPGASLSSILDQIDSGNLGFYDKKEKFTLTVKLSDFNLMKFDQIMYEKINLPFEISVFNNTFMKTKVFRLVSRKLPNTINQFSNITYPFEVEIGETKSFVVYLSIDSFDDVDWLIDNDVAFLMYSDNTTLSEIDFAIRCPDIRGLNKYSIMKDNTLDLTDQYEQGLYEFDDIIQSSFRIGDSATQYHKIKNWANFKDFYDDTSSPDFTMGQSALDSILKELQDDNIYANFDDYKSKYRINLPADFIHNLIYLNENKGFRDKFQFHIIRSTYYEITDHKYNIRQDEAKEYFNNWRSDVWADLPQNMIHYDITSQREKLDMLTFMIRVPFFGSEQMYVDLVFFITNIRSGNMYLFKDTPITGFIGEFMTVSAIVDDTPLMDNITMQYDISSQVKECLTIFQSLQATHYMENIDETKVLGYKFVNVDISSIDFSDIILESDITISYYHTNPLLSSKHNQLIYEHSDEFRTKLIEYDWLTFFDLTEGDYFPDDNSISLYTVDYTIQKQLYDKIGNTWEYDDSTEQIITNTIGLSVSNRIKYSFKVLSTTNISNGKTSLILTEASTNKDLDINIIDRIEIFNDGNQFLSISDVNIFYPNGKYDYLYQQQNKLGDDFLKSDIIPSDTNFYASMFDETNPVQVISFNTLTPGETGMIYLVYRINTTLLSTLYSTLFEIPTYTRIEFDSSLALYTAPICQGGFRNFGDINAYGENKQDNNFDSEMSYQYPQNYQFKKICSEIEFTPYTNNIIETDKHYQKSALQYDLAVLSDATVFSNKGNQGYIDMKDYGLQETGILRTGNYTPFSYMFVLPIPLATKNIGTIKELTNLCKMTRSVDINYKAYIMKFDNFLNSIIQDIKREYKLISLTISGVEPENPMKNMIVRNKTMYFRFDQSNEYQWFNYEQYDTDITVYPVNFKWFEKIKLSIDFMIPETQKNNFSVTFPKTMEYGLINQMSLVDMFLAEQTSDTTYESFTEIDRASGSAQKKGYYKERFTSDVNLGEIVGNKQITMLIDTDWMNLFRINSFSNFEISPMSIGPNTPDTFMMKIVKPELEHANIIFEFFKNDYTCDFTWEHKDAVDSVIANSGNYIIDPPYIDLQYIPIDETYSVMVKIKNQNPYDVDLTQLLFDSETGNTIKFMEFPQSDAYNILYYYFTQICRPYPMRPYEEVKLFLRIIPRRIGMNFFTIFLKFNNTIRPLSIEFKSFINNKAYFVLDEDSKVLDFGDVPIGKFEEDTIIVKNLGKVIGKINEIYTFGNDSKYFKILNKDSGDEMQRLSYNRVVKPRSSITIPVRFYSRSYGFNYAYCYIETNEPVFEDFQWFDGTDEMDFTQLYRNSPKYLASLMKANSVLEGEVIETDSYIFMGYVHPLNSRFRNYEIVINNKNKNNIVSVFRVTNMMKNYIKTKFIKEPFTKQSSVWLTLNPRGYTEGQYYDEIFLWMMVYSKKTRSRSLVLQRIPVTQFVTREQKLSFEVDTEEIIFVSKPFIKTFKKLNLTNYSNADATLYTHILTDHSGLFTMMPDLNDQTIIIPEGVTYTIALAFGGDQRFIGRYLTTLTVQMTLGSEVITHHIPVTGLVGDENVVKQYKRPQIMIG